MVRAWRTARSDLATRRPLADSGSAFSQRSWTLEELPGQIVRVQAATPRWVLHLLGLAALALVGLKLIILPVFHKGPVASDAFNHVALTTAALDTLAKTHAPPISSNIILEGREYPYFLFGNGSLYVVASIVSFLLRLQPYAADALVLGAGFACGAYGIFLLARRSGLASLPALAIGLLYAAGPFPSFDLFIRGGFPQYLAWQSMPLLALLAARTLQPTSSPVSLIGGAAGMAVPFYIHKLVAPHVIVAVVLVALTLTPLRVGTLLRLGVAGIIGVLWSVPAWHPTVTGQTGLVLADPGMPPPANHSLANLLWPFAQDSLSRPGAPPTGPYWGHFALQVGVLPVAGALLAVLVCVMFPRLALRRGLPVLLLAFALYLALILGWPAGWAHAPAYFRYLETTARLIGVAHFYGVILLVGATGIIGPRIGKLTRVGIAAPFLVLATISCATYWYAPSLLRHRTSTIWPEGRDDYRDVKPSEISNADSFLILSANSNLLTGSATILGAWLSDPPFVIAVPSGAPSVSFRGTVPDKLMLDQSPLTVELLAAEPADQEIRPGHEPAQPHVLKSVTLTAPGAFSLEAPLDSSMSYIAIRCSRTAPAKSVGASPTDTRPVCVHLDQLVVPNEGDQFVQPMDVPRERERRGAFGSYGIDMRGLPSGEYFLPTFYFQFVRLQDGSGAPMPLYQYNRVAAFRYDGHSAFYTVWYDLRFELGAVAAGAGLFLAYALVRLLISKRPRRDRSPA